MTLFTLFWNQKTLREVLVFFQPRSHFGLGAWVDSICPSPGIIWFWFIFLRFQPGTCWWVIEPRKNLYIMPVLLWNLIYVWFQYWAPKTGSDSVHIQYLLGIWTYLSLPRDKTRLVDALPRQHLLQLSFLSGWKVLFFIHIRHGKMISQSHRVFNWLFRLDSTLCFLLFPYLPGVFNFWLLDGLLECAVPSCRKSFLVWKSLDTEIGREEWILVASHKGLLLI